MKESFYLGTPFIEPVTTRTYRVGDGRMNGEYRTQYYLSAHHKIIRRIPNYQLDEKNPQRQVLDGVQKLRDFGSYTNLHVPNFDVIRGTLEEDDIRFEPYLFVVDEVEGDNLSVIKFKKCERGEAGNALESFSLSFIDFANDLYQSGGYYPSDQLLHQYVYGKTEDDTKNKVYFVDLDLKFNNFNRQDPSTLPVLTSVIVGFIGGIIRYSEVMANRRLSNARNEYSNLLSSLFDNPSLPSATKQQLESILNRIV